MQKEMKVIGLKTVTAMVRALRLQKDVVTCANCVQHQKTGRCDWLDRYTSDTNYCCWGHPTKEESERREQDEKMFRELKSKEDREIMLGLDTPLESYIQTIEKTKECCDKAIEMLKGLNPPKYLDHFTQDDVDRQFTEDDE